MDNGIKILVVDDNRTNLKTIESILKSDAELNIILANNAVDALHAIKINDIALVLLDIKMPGMDGFETAKKIREQQMHKEIPIIFLTALDPEDNCEFKVYESGAVDILYKPVNPFILKSKVAIFKKLYYQRRHLELKSKVLESTVSELQREIEKRKELEDHLRQSQKMETVGTLAGGIAHDFNNILTAVMGYVELAMLEIQHDEHVKPYLEKVLSASNRARDLVEHILLFSRKQTKTYQPVLVKYIVKESLELLRASLPSFIKITQHIGKESVAVNADATQIHQIVMNLCTNAWHAIGDKEGEIYVGLQPVTLDATPDDSGRQMLPGAYLELTVRDTGCGMASDVCQRIFEPYFTTKKVGEGTGMGLAVVHGILAGYGGGVKVESVPGEGAQFKLYFPVSDARQSAHPDVQKAIPGGSGHILIVDDESQIIDLETRMLTRLGYHVTGHTNSLEALEAFTNDPTVYDLIITDMTMPDLSGDELAKQIRLLNPKIPIILCSGYHNKLFEKGASALHADALLMKPIEIRDLAVAIHQYLIKE